MHYPRLVICAGSPHIKHQSTNSTKPVSPAERRRKYCYGDSAPLLALNPKSSTCVTFETRVEGTFSPRGPSRSLTKPTLFATAPHRVIDRATRRAASGSLLVRIACFATRASAASATSVSIRSAPRRDRDRARPPNARVSRARSPEGWFARGPVPPLGRPGSGLRQQSSSTSPAPNSHPAHPSAVLSPCTGVRRLLQPYDAKFAAQLHPRHSISSLATVVAVQTTLSYFRIRPAAGP